MDLTQLGDESLCNHIGNVGKHGFQRRFDFIEFLKILDGVLQAVL